MASDTAAGDRASASRAAPPLRVCILQQIVPHYRVPLFDLLARQPGIELSVWSDMHPTDSSLKPAKGTGRFEMVHAPLKWVGPFMWQPAQIAAAKSGRFDVIIYSWNARLAHLARALRLCRRRGVPTLLWGHGISKQESPLRRRMRNRLLNIGDGCILYNHGVADQLTGEGFDRGRIFVALNAIDQSPVQAARVHWLARPEELEAFRKARGLIGRETMLFVSRLEPEKRVDALIEAFALAKRRRPAAQLAIVGRGPEEPRLRDIATRLGVAEDVIFVGPLYEEMDLAPWFLSSRCMPYTVNLGLSLLHSFGYGLPVITCDNASLHGPEIEAMRDGENGLLYPDGDVPAFADAIVRCLSDDALRARLAAGALATVQPPDGFCIENMITGFMRAITSVARRPMDATG